MRSPLHRTLDLDLRAKEQRRRAANLQRHLRLLRIVLNVRTVAGRNRRPLILGRTCFRVARLPRGRLNTRTQFRPSLDRVLLGHNLLALDPALLVPGAARLGALGPLVHLPANGTVEHVAVLTFQRRRLRTHVVRHHHCVLAAARHLVDALHLSLANPNAARLGARRILGVVPARRTRPVVARANASLRFGFR